jgi:23S rRNA (cytosine1962-C5)-methyltransferase
MYFSRTFPTNASQNRIAVKLNVSGERSVVHGHPWVFSNSILKTNQGPKTGDLAIIFGKNKNKIIGFGLFDLSSPIQIKMVHHGDAISIDNTFFYNKVLEAYNKRAPLLLTETNSYRLIFGENDGFPGLIADVYANVLVVKLYSEIWIDYLQGILESLIEVSQCETIVIRLSRNLQQSKLHDLKDGEVVFGMLENNVVQFEEHGVFFSADVIQGHKTGYFLDHRLNRKQVGEWSRDKTVLDVFSYAGGFSVHALINGAKEVTSLDISNQALEMAKSNAKLNNFSGKHLTISGDAFKELKHLISDNKTFDVVVIDPPSFAKQQSEIDLAKKKYAQLADLGLRLTRTGGLLVLASCSSRILAQTFFDINARVIRESNRSHKCILKTQHDIDHPIGFPEGAYLKCAYYRINN